MLSLTHRNHHTWERRSLYWDGALSACAPVDRPYLHASWWRVTVAGCRAPIGGQWHMLHSCCLIDITDLLRMYSHPYCYSQEDQNLQSNKAFVLIHKSGISTNDHRCSQPIQSPLRRDQLHSEQKHRYENRYLYGSALIAIKSQLSTRFVDFNCLESFLRNLIYQWNCYFLFIPQSLMRIIWQFGCS